MRRFKRPHYVSGLALTAFAATAAILPDGATAQPSRGIVNSCVNKFFVNAIYPAGPGPVAGGFRYVLQVQNRTTERMNVNIDFSGFPPDVVIYETTLSYGPFNSYEQREITIGHSVQTQLSAQNVHVAYDGGGATGPTVRLSRCSTP